MKTTISTIVLFLLPLSSYAQEKPRKPVEPILRMAPSNAAWTVRLKQDVPAEETSWESAFDDTNSPTGSKTETRHVTRRTYEKNGSLKTYHVSTVWNDGETQDDWIVMGRHVAERAGNRGLYVAGTESSLGEELATSDFPELSWLEMKHYRGVQTYKGTVVFVFAVPFDQKAMTITDNRYFNFVKQGDPKATPKDVFKPRHDRVVAYLDAETQLPVLYDDGTTLHRYSFSRIETPIRPPKKIIDFLREREEALQIRTATPAGPGAGK